ncbi:ABC transporter permease [Cohnella zeiphila]|uniref:ABC transporter permease n=1 Tax=Cohnella zeiphila TaxID=2761120 RepID=A0A7X0SKU5_9BACL|nr:ABC transporter permease [Cohnella zeiphila]MBB6730560.1 ABC transporter permease [Cohnella zeiphila]
MLLRILSAEFLKIRRKWLWVLVVAGPLGVVALQGVNFGLRYDYLVRGKQPGEVWDALIGDVSMLAMPALLMGLAIVASMSAGIEHQMNAWKLTLALPVSKRQVFAGKFVLTALLLLVSSALLVPLSAAFGLTLGLGGGSIPWSDLLTDAFYPYLASMPFIALQAWLSVTMANQAVPLTVGIIGMIVSLFAGARFPDWVPYKWPQLAVSANDPLYAVAAGVAFGIVVFAVGLTEFVRKDVK